MPAFRARNAIKTLPAEHPVIHIDSTLALAPSIRPQLASGEAGEDLARRFDAFQQIMWDLYEMQRKKAMRIVPSLRAGQLHTSSGTKNAQAPERHVSNSRKLARMCALGSDATSTLFSFHPGFDADDIFIVSRSHFRSCVPAQ